MPKKGYQLTEEHKKKISEALQGRELSEEHKKKMNEAHKGKKMSKEARKNISESKSGKNNHMYGKTHSEEARKKMSENSVKYWKGEKLSEEHKRKLSEAKKGCKLSEEHKRKIGKAHKGKKRSKETGQKISEKRKGIEFSEETKKKMSENSWQAKHKGKLSPYWIEDRSKLAKRQKRNDMAYKEWRAQVYKRDKYKCRINNDDCNGRIIAHHILSWRDYLELRYDVNNGVTLCEHHHPKTRKREKETQIFFQELLNNNSICEVKCEQKI